jgi:putative sigma-54 modulation protein
VPRGPVESEVTVQVTVSVRHGHLSEDVQNQLKEKGEKLLHFFNRLTMVSITVDLHKEHNGMLKVEVQANAEHKHDFVASDVDSDVVHAFNKAVSHLKHQITHYKEKIQDHRRDPDHGGNNGK